MTQTYVAPRPHSATRPPEPKRAWTTGRIFGHVLVLFWTLLIAGLLAYLYSVWDPELVAKYGPRYWTGLKITITLVVLSFLFGAILSLPVTYGRMSKNRILSNIAAAYVHFFRGTPLIAQVFLIYYGFGAFPDTMKSLGLWWFFRDAFNCALFSFALNTAAYQAEILRGAIQSVSAGQWEGAASLGISRIVTFCKIILPQALIVALRPYGNELILLMKASAISSIVTVSDLMGVSSIAYAQTFDFQTYLWTAIIYLLLVEVLRHVWDWMERRITRHLIR